MTTIITPRILSITTLAVPLRKSQNRVAEEIVVLATVEEIAKAGKVAVDGVAHKEVVKVAAAIQNQRATVALRAASKKELANAVIAAEVVIAKYRLRTESHYFIARKIRSTQLAKGQPFNI
jgi:hypothetical protein